MQNKSSNPCQTQRPWSIASMIRQKECDWLKNNDFRWRLRYGWFERELLIGAEHPVRYALSLLILLVLVVANGYLIPDNLFVGCWSSWDKSEQLNYFTTLWSIQSTIVALVYPFVISFVSLLLQRRPVSKAFLQIYLIDSGALVAGMSSLSLVLAMTVEYILLTSYSLGHAVTWVAVNAVWFCYNIVLTIWFLFRTVEFLRPDFQMEVVRRYAVNVALPREVANLIKFQLFAGAQNNGWIVAPEYLDDKAKGKPQVLMRSFGVSMGEAVVERRLSVRSRLSSVLYWPLNVAIKGWIRTAERYLSSSPDRASDESKYPLLIFPVVPGRTYESSLILARVAYGPRLSWLQRLLVKVSFRFSVISLERRCVTLANILAEIEADARISADKGDVAAFEDAYESLITMHESLLAACLVTSDEGGTDSWALLPDIHRFADHPLHKHWTDAYRSLFNAAVNILPKESRPLRRLCHVVQHLSGQSVQDSPVNIRENFLYLHPWLMSVLGNWWSQRLEEQGVMEHGHDQMALLRPPLQSAYEEMFVHFVGGWEEARDRLAFLPDQNVLFVWSEATALMALNKRHINQTGLMLLMAVSRGDKAAAEWMADVLVKWWGSAGHSEHDYNVLFGKSDFITLESISQQWSVVEQSMGLNEDIYQRTRNGKTGLQRIVLFAAIKNYWRDIRILTIEIMLTWAQSEHKNLSERSLALYIIAGLLIGRHWRAGGRVTDPLSKLNASDYLTAKARQYAADSSCRDGYIAQLDSFVESAKNILRPDMVPGRIYSYSGADDVDSLQEAQLILLTLHSSADWKASETLLRQLATWTSTCFNCTTILKSRIDAMRSRLETVGDQLCTKLIDMLLVMTSREHTRSQGIARTKAGISALLDEIAGLHSNAVANANVSARRLREVEVAASAQAFTAESGEFPIQLFSKLVRNSMPQKKFTLCITNLRKGEFTEVEMEQRAVNENEWYAKTIANHLGALLLADVVRMCNVREVIAPDADTYWTVLKDESLRFVKQRLTPILILDNPTRPDWIWEWQYPDVDGAYPRPADLTVRQEHRGRGDGYVCDLNKIQVYSGSVASGTSLLIARETFSSVAFREYHENVFVKAETENVPESKTLVNLKLSYERAVEVAFPNIVRIRYDTSTASKEEGVGN